MRRYTGLMTVSLPIPVKIVSQAAQLDASVKAMLCSSAIALDTESNSLHRYPEQLCLIQIATPQRVYVIDAIVLKEIAALEEVLDSSVTKVIHGADYDIRSLDRHYGFRIRNVYDTNIAARFAGLTRVGLAALLEDLLGVTIPKSTRLQRGDWGRRPLSAEAVDYAATDIRHLFALRETLAQRIQALGRTEWVAEECARLEEVRYAAPSLETAYLTIKGAKNLDGRGLAILRSLFLFREEEARRQRRPPFFVISHTALIALATSPTVALSEVPGLGQTGLKRFERGLQQALCEGLAAPPIRRLPPMPDELMSREQIQRLRRLKAWRVSLGTTLSLDPSLLWPTASLERLAKAVIEANNPLELVTKAIRGLGYGGDIKPALITYLAATSRLLEMRTGAMPVHLLLTGPSSGGKSYTLGVIKTLMPSESYRVIDAGSPRVLIYDEAPLKHKAVIFGEADSLPAGEDNPAASAVRNLLQDHHLHYEVTIRDRETGEYGVKKIDRDGPTVLITTSTRSLGDQLMTRFFTLELGDSREQICAALEMQAGLETKGVPCPDTSLVAFQAYLQLQAPIKVTVPYATELAAGMENMASAPRILRDFQRLISLIKAVALIRHHQRQLDSEGRIVAELADYETVRGLVNDMYVDSSTGATSDIRRLVEAIITLDTKRAGGERITNTTLSRHLNIGVMQASRRAKRALKLGWLVNREQRKYHPADYAPGEPMPETEGLPMLGVNTANIVNNERVNDSSLENGTVNTLTPLTNSSISPLGMPLEKAIEIWRKEGAPVIHLCPGENCLDLEKLLSNPDVKPEHLEAVRDWLEKTIKRRGES